MAARILVVDDEKDLELLMRQKFRHKISSGELVFDFAFNGQEALVKVKSEGPFDMMITDINMPEMDGLTLLGKIREEGSHLKAVVVSAYGDMANIRTAMNRGAFDFLTKPINFKDLEVTIEKTLREAELIREGIAARENLERATIDREIAVIEKQKAEESRRLEQQFLANMSHEIRTPMNAVIGMTNLVLKTKLDEQQLKYIKAIKVSSDNLLVIINDILEVSKIEAGKIELEQIPFLLDEVLGNVNSVLHFRAEEKGLKLVMEQESGIPGLLGDPSRLNQVLINLVGNAIKFTARGSVEVKCRIAERSGDKVHIAFSVKDTGIGISEEQIGKIFERFTQASSDTNRKYGGTGLGLTISRQLVGSIGATSKPGEGTTFTFTIPYAVAGDVAASKTPAALPLSELRTTRILLVEDNAFNQIVAVDTLKEYLPEATVHVAENGNVAIKKLQEETYDLVLMDIQMPEMDGYDATQYIRRQFSSPLNAIPILAMTANATRGEIEKCRLCGMNDHIAKPFVPENLLLKMAEVLGGRRSAAK